MGSRPSKQPEQPKSVPTRIEDQIPTYQRPQSPQYEEAKLQDVGIRPDDNIDREAANRKQAEKQRKSKIEQQQQPQNNQEAKKVRPYLSKQLAKQAQQIKQNNTIDLSYEKVLDLNDIKQLERQLESDDLSPINKSSTESQKQEQDKQKILVSEQKIWKLKQKIKRTFNWPARGSVFLVSVGFKYQYSYKTQKIAVTNSYDTYVNSILSWSNNPQLGVYEFKLKDTDIYNTESGNVQQLQFNEIEFMVDYNGIFIGIKHESDFMKNITQQKRQYESEQIKEAKERDKLLNNQLSNLERLATDKLKPKLPLKQKKKKQDQIIKQTEKQLEQFWNSAFQCWYTVDEDNAQKIFFSDTECLVMEKKDEEVHSKLENFLVKKLQDPQFFNVCFNSPKTIRDPLKKWGMFSEEEILGYLGEPKYSVVQLQKKVTFPILQKYQISRGILSNKDLAPQVVKWESCRKTVIEHQKDLFVDLESERRYFYLKLRLLTFIWEKQLDVKTKLRTENIFVEELNKFRDECDTDLKEMLFQLSTIPNFPMENRPKYKQKYFQIY